MISPSTPITWVESEILNLVTTAVAGVSDAIVTLLTPLVAICYGFYVLIMAIGYIRGGMTDPVTEVAIKVVSGALVVGIGFSIGTYNAFVMPVLTEFSTALQCAVSTCDFSAGVTTLDQLAVHYVKMLDEGLEEAKSIINPISSFAASFNVWLKFGIILLGLVPFLVLAAVTVIIAKSFLLIVAAIAPIYFATWLFPSTRQYFSAWLNTAFSYALIPLFVALITLISVEISKKMFDDPGSTLLDSSTITVVFASIGNLVLLFILRQVASLASSLSAGGINMSVPGTLGSFARGLGNHRLMSQSGKVAKTTAKYAAKAYQKIKSGNSIKKAG